MIISRLIGGLGNQMFQYSAAKALALKFEKKLYLDILGFKSYSLHQGYQLNDIFIGEFNIASSAQVENFLSPYYIKNFTNFTEYQPFIRFSSKFIREPSLDFHPNLFIDNKDYYLSGYWQSENYFKEFEDVIRAQLTFKPFSDDNNCRLAENILLNENSASIHIRRGDYLKSKIHNVVSLDYYLNAINYLNSRFANIRYFIFSDDIEWVKSKLKLNNLNINFVTNNGGKYSFNDMHLMSLCKHSIIANSSFSWWGAWLRNKYNKGLVISPKNWFSTGAQPKNLIPNNWITF